MNKRKVEEYRLAEDKNSTVNYGKALEALRQIDASQGLPEEVFLAVSALVPIANVDLLVKDKAGRVLLSWRDDPFFGKGWHIPGGCIRYRETMRERVHKTAAEELHAQVRISEPPLAVRDVITARFRSEAQTPRERAHHLAVLFECTLPEDYVIDNGSLRENDSGYLKWFERIPENILDIHACYNDIFEKYNLR